MTDEEKTLKLLKLFDTEQAVLHETTIVNLM